VSGNREGKEEGKARIDTGSEIAILPPGRSGVVERLSAPSLFSLLLCLLLSPSCLV